MSISANVKYIREMYGLSQLDFGKIAGVSDKAVSTWELGVKTPRMGAIEKISQHFNIPKSKILDEDLTLPETKTHQKEPAQTDAPDINTIIYNRNGKVIKKSFSKEEMEILSKMIEGIQPDEDL
ncbi:MAG: helix-turn-helix transcriptional regulator [Bacteroidales bacterium]